MTGRHFRVFLAIAISCVASTASANVCVSPSIQRANPCGWVFDQARRPVAHAVVVFRGGAKREISVVSDQRGFFAAPVNGQNITFEVALFGWASISQNIDSVQSSGKCGKPIFAVLKTSSLDCGSFATTNKKELSKVKE